MSGDNWFQLLTIALAIYAAVGTRKSQDSQSSLNVISGAEKLVDIKNALLEQAENECASQAAYIKYLQRGISRMSAQLKRLKVRSIFSPVSLTEFVMQQEKRRLRKNL